MTIPDLTKIAFMAEYDLSDSEVVGSERSIAIAMVNEEKLVLGAQAYSGGGYFG